MYNVFDMLGEQISHAPTQITTPEAPPTHTIADLTVLQEAITAGLNSTTEGRTSGDMIKNGIIVSKNGGGSYWIKKPGVFISIGPYEDDYFGIKSKISVSLEYQEGENLRRDTYCFNDRGEGGKSKRNGHAEAPDELTQKDIDRIHEALSGVKTSLY